MCRRFRAALLPHRRQLVARALRCANATPACARDLVAPCRRCRTIVVCRVRPAPAQPTKPHPTPQPTNPPCPSLPQNCIAKPASRTSLLLRLRRLCSTCAAPAPPTAPPCTCPQNPWLCRPCAQRQLAADTAHRRAWSWHAHYGVAGADAPRIECARAERCEAASAVSREVEADPADPVEHDDAGYAAAEIRGIGGRVKRKTTRVQWVGAAVSVRADDEGAEPLRAEREGRSRAWCAWCGGVVEAGGA